MDGKPEGWADFSRTFKAILRTCDPAIGPSVRLWTALPAFAIQYGDKEMAIITAVSRLLVLKLPKGPMHDQVTSLVQGLRHVRACLRAVQAEDKMFSSMGTVATLLHKLPESIHREWFRFQEEHPEKAKGNLFQQWVDKEGDAATRQIGRTPAPSPPAGGSGGGSGGVKGPPLMPPRDQAPGGGRTMDTFLTTTDSEQ